MNEWEKVEQNLRRMKIYGGWIVESFSITTHGDNIAVCFVPDNEHKWEITENKPKEGA